MQLQIRCKNNICGCWKKRSFCGPGCLCQGCTNLPETHNSDDFDDGIHSTDSESDSTSDGSTSDDRGDDILAEEIITDDFHFEISDTA